MANIAIDVMWDDNPVDVTAEANFIWSIANKLRGSYMPDKYGDVIIPMTIWRRRCSGLREAIIRELLVLRWNMRRNFPVNREKSLP